ncbi:mitochondrial import protein Pam17-domain-containing protein [Syncephalis fuscata]|nr:mitochondrial import protein Pam17-domain-containing protein [Syncephalis fuscata]
MLLRHTALCARAQLSAKRLLTIRSYPAASNLALSRSLLPMRHSFYSKSDTTNSTENRSTTANAPGSLPAHYRFPISWTEYFEIRRKRILQERITTVPTTLVGLIGGIGFFGTRSIDVTANFMGMDPFLMYGLGAFACGIIGFLLGPVVASTTWRMSNRRLAGTIDEMDRELYRHIVKYRSDPSLSSVRNPVPDYYGEKIRSLRDYRRWLRRQLEHRRKGTFQLGEEVE